MLHATVVVRPERAEAAIAAMRGVPGVTNVQHRRAAVEPSGDVVEADVAREAADGLLDALRPAVLDAGGTVTLLQVDTALGAPIRQAEADAPGQGDDAVVWEEVAQRTSEESSLSVTFLAFLVIAMLISAVGVITDSSVLVVGGMVLGPEFGPLAAIAVGLVSRRWRLAWRSMRALLVGFPIGVAITAAGTALVAATMGLPKGYLDGNRPLTSFVSHPDAWSVIVALLAGAAGTLSLTSAKSSAIVGVFISVTTIPAAANTGAALVAGLPGEALGAAVQLVVNIACILVSAVAVLLLQRLAARRRRAAAARNP
ncbi:DUF389 domain-containing protein [Amnibacterium endophyticum]|uniref:DUF389 domain-containing protein n=1 Tax=Amnibacterium endophyticum TaxID=2109337 RepID=A0ABW4LGT3_9MICO